MVVRLLWFSGRALVAQPRGVIWLSGCCGSVVEHWWLNPEVSYGCPAVVVQWQSTGGSSQRCPSWVRLLATAGFFSLSSIFAL